MYNLYDIYKSIPRNLKTIVYRKLIDTIPHKYINFRYKPELVLDIVIPAKLDTPQVRQIIEHASEYYDIMFEVRGKHK